MANDELNQQLPDTSEPSDERKVELEAAYERQKDTDAPYKGVKIRTLGELQWIMAQRNWSVEEDLPDGMQRANLTGVNLIDTDLRDIRLIMANLSGAALSRADLSSADLYAVNLSGASLDVVDLSGASLTRALTNAETVLDNITLDAETRVFATRWNGAPLDGIDWTQAPRLGDEPTKKDLTKMNAKERAIKYRYAARAYHGLAVALHDQGLADDASKYRLRELVMERKALRYEHNYGGWLLNALLGAVAGHGEKPNRAFAAYLGIVTTFALIFWLVTNFLHSGAPPLQWYEAAVLSVSSFHGRGFFTSTIQLGDPLAIVAAFEAVMGLFIELVFISTFSKRFFGD